MVQIGSKLYMTACASGKTYDPAGYPNWTRSSSEAADYIREWTSVDGGVNWTPDPAPLIRASKNSSGSDNLFQPACINSRVFLNGKYYLVFEAFLDPKLTPDNNNIPQATWLDAIHIARADNPGGPYSILTVENGWEAQPTQGTWRPIILPKPLDVPNLPATGSASTDSYGGRVTYLANSSTDQVNPLYGAGLPSLTQKDGQLYIYYIDGGTVFFGNSSSGGPYWYGGVPRNPASLLAIVPNPDALASVPFTLNNHPASVVTPAILPTLGYIRSTARYFPDRQLFLNFNFVKGSDGYPELDYQQSSDGTNFGTSAKVASLPKMVFSRTNPDTAVPLDVLTPALSIGIHGVSPSVHVMGNPLGQASFSDLRFAMLVTYPAPGATNDGHNFNNGYSEAHAFRLIPNGTHVPIINYSYRTPSTAFCAAYPGVCTGAPANADGSSDFFARGLNVRPDTSVHVRWPSSSSDIWYYNGSPSTPLPIKPYDDPATHDLTETFSIHINSSGTAYLDYLNGNNVNSQVSVMAQSGVTSKDSGSFETVLFNPVFSRRYLPYAGSNLNCTNTYTGLDGVVGLSNGDTRFICSVGNWYDCGWEGSASWDTHVGNGQVVRGYQCDFVNRRWQYVPAYAL